MIASMVEFGAIYDKGEPAPERPILVRVHEPFVSLDMFDFDTARHAYSVQDAMRLVAHHKEGVIVLLRRHEPEVYARARHVLLPKDYVRYRLTGALARSDQQLGELVGNAEVDELPLLLMRAARAIRHRIDDGVGEEQVPVAAELVVIADVVGEHNHNPLSARTLGSNLQGSLHDRSRAASH